MSVGEPNAIGFYNDEGDAVESDARLVAGELLANGSPGVRDSRQAGTPAKGAGYQLGAWTHEGDAEDRAGASYVVYAPNHEGDLDTTNGASAELDGGALELAEEIDGVRSVVARLNAAGLLMENEIGETTAEIDRATGDATFAGSLSAGSIGLVVIPFVVVDPGPGPDVTIEAARLDADFGLTLKDNSNAATIELDRATGDATFAGEAHTHDLTVDNAARLAGGSFVPSGEPELEAVRLDVAGLLLKNDANAETVELERATGNATFAGAVKGVSFTVPGPALEPGPGYLAAVEMDDEGIALRSDDGTKILTLHRDNSEIEASHHGYPDGPQQLMGLAESPLGNVSGSGAGDVAFWQDTTPELNKGSMTSHGDGGFYNWAGPVVDPGVIAVGDLLISAPPAEGDSITIAWPGSSGMTFEWNNSNPPSGGTPLGVVKVYRGIDLAECKAVLELLFDLTETDPRIDWSGVGTERPPICAGVAYGDRAAQFLSCYTKDKKPTPGLGSWNLTSSITFVGDGWLQASSQGTTPPTGPRRLVSCEREVTQGEADHGLCFVLQSKPASAILIDSDTGLLVPFTITNTQIRVASPTVGHTLYLMAVC